MKDPIKTITRGDGSKRYRFVVDIGRDANGKRQQKTFTFDLKREARAEYDRIRHQARDGTYVGRWNGTVAEVIDAYLATALFEKEENTKVAYATALKPARERLGSRRAQSITRDDIEALRDWLLAAGRKRGGKVGTGLGAESVRGTLARLKAAFEQAVEDGRLIRNPAAYVKPPKVGKSRRDTWSRDEVHQFLAVADNDRLAAAWRMTLYGMRRGEVLGLRWAEDIDMEAETVRIGQSRVLVSGRVLAKCPKSEHGYRTLPLDAELMAVLRALRVRQLEERMAVGPAYEDSGYVVTDELGRPIAPHWYSREFVRVARWAGVPRIRLHDGRHSCLTLMEHAGVPISIISRWAGHYDSAFTYKQYVHASDDDLAAGRDALAKIYKIG